MSLKNVAIEVSSENKGAENTECLDMVSSFGGVSVGSSMNRWSELARIYRRGEKKKDVKVDFYTHCVFLSFCLSVFLSF